MEDYFVEQVAEHLEPVILGREDTPPFLKDHTSYLVAELQPGPGIRMGTARPELGIVEVPSPPLPRFLSTPGPGESRNIVFLDDVIRLNLHRVFPERLVAGAYAVKVSRDADLYLDDEFDTGLRQAIKKSLGKRATGAPIRFLYDMRSPQAMVTRLSSSFGLGEGDLIEGGRYHNLNDLTGLPVGDQPGVGGCSALEPLPHPHAGGWRVVPRSDPDQGSPAPFSVPILCVLWSAFFKRRPQIRMWTRSGFRCTGFPVTPRSSRALIEAAENGKEVMAFVEVQARFDEELNLEWAKRMELSWHPCDSWGAAASRYMPSCA